MKKGLLYALGMVALSASFQGQVSFEKTGTYQAQGEFDDAGTEIIAYDENTKTLFSTNGGLNQIDLIDLSNPSNPVLITSIDLRSYGGGINSVATNGTIIAAAIEAAIKQDNGVIGFWTTDGTFITTIEVGALPDMVTFNNAGDKVIVANEGEPSANYDVDPEGSISVISIPSDVTAAGDYEHTLLSFNAFDAYKKDLIASGVRIYGGTTPFAVTGFEANNADDQDTITVNMSAVDVKPSLELLGHLRTGSFDEGAAEIIAVDVESNKAFATNAELDVIDIIDYSDPAAPTKIGTLEFNDITEFGGINSVAVNNGLVAVAVENDDKQANGWIVFFDTDGNKLAEVNAGALPDMVTFSHDGVYAIAANEGEPSQDYSNDPEGSVTVITIPSDVSDWSAVVVNQINFNSFDNQKAQLKAAGVRIYGGVEAQAVTAFTEENTSGNAEITVADATNFAPHMWISLDSDNSDEDVDFVRAYQIKSVNSNVIELTTEFDYDEDAGVVEEGTNIYANPTDWTVYLADGSSTVSQDLEPEYVAVSPDNTTAWIACQENNAIVVIDLVNKTASAVNALGTKDHSATGNGLDASNKDDKINIVNQPVHGMYMPDAIVSYTANGNTYYVTANEGDAREYEAFLEEMKIKDIEVDASAFDNTDFQDSKEAGSAKTSIFSGDANLDGLFEKVHTYGARSFTIWDENGNVVFDSGDDFEQITAQLFPAEFNSTNDETDFDDRSDNKGPEPEALTVGEWMGNTYAFVGLERMGGIMVYNISDPTNAEYVTYITSRDFNADPEQSLGLAPEDIKFISGADSPTGNALLFTSNEVSGTVEIFEITDQNGLMTGSWITVDSDNSDDNADFVRTYQIAGVDGNNIIVEELDYDEEEGVIVEGTDINAAPSAWTVHLLNRTSSVSQDIEPEYIAVSTDDTKAFATLQENNAFAVIDLENMNIADIIPMGTKDHSLAENSLDANDKDKEANLKPLPLHGMYMPDAISTLEFNGATYFVTANEGDAREYDGLIEELKAGDIPLDPATFPSASTLQENDSIGRIKTSIFSGDDDMDGDFDRVHVYGARSFSIWDENGSLVWDSKNFFETLLADEYPESFNTTNDATKLDNRSDNKGPEPEAITIGEFKGITYVFVGLERMGGIMVFKIEDVNNPEFVSYINDRAYDEDPENQGDLAPEDIKFWTEGDDQAYIAVSNEVSGTVSIYSMAEVISPTAITSTASSNKFVAMPNPATDYINIIFTEDNAEFTVSDINGNVVRRGNTSNAFARVDLSGEASGMYIINVLIDETNYFQKVMVK